MKNSTINAHKFALTSLFSAVVLTGCQTIEQNSNINTATQIPTQATTTPTVPIIPKVVRKLEPSDNAEIIIMGPVNYDGLFKKLSTREIEVLRYLNDGKKNKEVAQILGLDEKTISTYKLRLLAKLNVTNLVDLLKKAKDLDVI